MIIKTKRILIKNEIMGRNKIEEIRKTCGDNVANEISFNVPVYNFGTDEIACHIPETNDWYLEFPEEIIITY